MATITNPRTTASASQVKAGTTKGTASATPNVIITNPRTTASASQVKAAPTVTKPTVSSGKVAVQGPPIITATGAPAGSQNIPYPNGTMYPTPKGADAANNVKSATGPVATTGSGKNQPGPTGQIQDVDANDTNQINALNATLKTLANNVAAQNATIAQLQATSATTTAWDLAQQQQMAVAQADAANNASTQYDASTGTAPAATPVATSGISGFLSGTTGKIVVYGGIAAGGIYFARQRGLLK